MTWEVVTMIEDDNKCMSRPTERYMDCVREHMARKGPDA